MGGAGKMVRKERNEYFERLLMNALIFSSCLDPFGKSAFAAGQCRHTRNAGHGFCYTFRCTLALYPTLLWNLTHPLAHIHRLKDIDRKIFECSPQCSPSTHPRVTLSPGHTVALLTLAVHFLRVPPYFRDYISIPTSPPFFSSRF